MSPGPAGPETDEASPAVEAVRRRSSLAIAFVTWLATIIAPALTFDIKLSLSSEAGPQFQAYFLLLTTALFLLVWRSLERLPIWVLAAFAMLSLISFVSYGLVKDAWTCAYYPNIFDERFMMGTELLEQPRAFIKANPSAAADCQALMENWAGDASKIWTWPSVVQRFLALFGLYAFAWLMLALLLLGAARHSLARWRN